MTLQATYVASLLGTQGAQGLCTRSGAGAPTTSTVAVDGEPYVDTTGAVTYPARASGSWAAGQSLVGPAGAAGAAGGSATNPGAYGSVTVTTGYNAQTTLSGSWSTLPIPGTTSFYRPLYPQAPGYLARATLTFTVSGTTSVTFRCYDEANGTTLYTSPTYTSSSTADLQLTPTSYPFVAGGKISWQVMGSGSILGNVQAQYLMAAGRTPALRTLTPAAYTTVNAAANLAVMSVAGTAAQLTMTPPSTALLANVTAQNQSAGAVTLTLTNGAKTIWRSGTIAAGAEYNSGGQSLTISNAVLDSASAWYWTVSGNVTAPVYLQAQVYI